MGGCSIRLCDSVAGWECQGFHAPGVWGRSRWINPSILMPQWSNAKVHFTHSLKGPLGEWASVVTVVTWSLTRSSSICLYFLSPTPLQCSLRLHPKRTMHTSPCLRHCFEETTGQGCLCYMPTVGVKMRKHFENNIVSTGKCKFLSVEQ